MRELHNVGVELVELSPQDFDFFGAHARRGVGPIARQGQQFFGLNGGRAGFPVDVD
jgi:hypothetical protein